MECSVLKDSTTDYISFKEHRLSVITNADTGTVKIVVYSQLQLGGDICSPTRPVFDCQMSDCTVLQDQNENGQVIPLRYDCPTKACSACQTDDCITFKALAAGNKTKKTEHDKTEEWNDSPDH